MGLTYSQCKALGIEHLYPTGGKSSQPVVVPPSKSAAPDDGMNKTERRLSVGLEFMKQRGKILDWAFEPEKFRMADRTWFRPDFRVTLIDGRNVFVEVKCLRKDGSVHWTDDGAVKVKTVPELHPYAFFLAAWGDRKWKITRLPSRKWSAIHVDIHWDL